MVRVVGGRRNKRIGPEFKLGPLAWLLCNIAIIVANSAIKEGLGRTKFGSRTEQSACI